MRLEDEIQQLHFTSLGEKTGVNMIFTYNWYVEKLNRLFKDKDLTMQQFNILRILRGHYPTPASIKTIRERMLDKMPDVSRLVDKLCEKELVTRHECPLDRRNVDILITQRGKCMLEILDKEMQALKQLFQHMTEEELLTLNRLLDKAREGHVGVASQR
jgi:DNA-binding MarR family transcriptional regulator